MLKGESFVAPLKEKSLQGYHLNLQDNIFPCIHKWVSGKGGYGWTRRIENTLLHLHNTYFSYLTWFLQQYSFPNPGVDLLSIIDRLSVLECYRP